MKRKITLIIGILIVLSVAFYLKRENTSTITFYNKTEESIENFEIKYSSEENWEKVGEIKAKGKLKIKSIPPENFQEGTVDLRYFDKAGNEKIENIVGYTEKLLKFHAKVEILSVDKDGVFKLEIR